MALSKHYFLFLMGCFKKENVHSGCVNWYLHVPLWMCAHTKHLVRACQRKTASGLRILWNSHAFVFQGWPVPLPGSCL